MILKEHLSTEQQLVEHLQQLLDIQWDALIGARGSELEYTRHEILHAMSQLIYKVFEPKKRLLQQAIHQDHELIEMCTELNNRIMTTETEIENKSKIKEPELVKLDQEIKINEESIAEVEAKLLELQKHNEELHSRKNEIRISIDSETASLKKDLGFLQRERNQTESGDSVQARIDLTKESLEKTVSEITALRGGILLWTQTISLVQELEENMKSASSAEHLYSLLTEAKHGLQGFLSTATEKKWTLLSVALSHENEAITQGIKLLRSKGIMEKSSGADDVAS